MLLARQAFTISSLLLFLCAGACSEDGPTRKEKMADLKDFLVMYYPLTTEVQQVFKDCRAKMDGSVPVQDAVASIDLTLEKIDRVKKAVRWHTSRNADVEQIKQNYLELHDAQIAVLNLARKGLTTKDESVSQKYLADFEQAIVKQMIPAATKAGNAVDQYARSLGLK